MRKNNNTSPSKMGPSPSNSRAPPSLQGHCTHPRHKAFPAWATLTSHFLRSPQRLLPSHTVCHLTTSFPGQSLNSFWTATLLPAHAQEHLPGSREDI